MPTGVQHANEILQDLACPVCEYNLRGLRGEVVLCPECGARSDVARLMQARWRMPWRRAPGFNRLAWPLAWLVLAGALVFSLALKRWVIDVASGRSAWLSSLPVTDAIVTGLGLLVLAGVWLFLMIRIYHREGGHSAVGMALLAHAAYLAYILSFIAVIVAIYFVAFYFLFNGRFAMLGRSAMLVVITVVGSVLGLGFGVLLGYLGLRGERAIGHWCIRRFILGQEGHLPPNNIDLATPASPRDALVTLPAASATQLPALTPALSRYMSVVEGAAPALSEGSASASEVLPSSPNTTGREIDRDVACPACNYNLRGLRGAVVSCPECGERCDVAVILARRWNGPWDRVPGLDTIQRPALCAILGFSLSILCAPLGFIIWALAWGLCVWRVWVVFHRVECFKLVAISHAVLLGYLAGALGPIVLALGALIIAIPRRIDLICVGVALIPVGLVSLIFCRRVERSLCEPAIRWYLMGPPPK